MKTAETDGTIFEFLLGSHSFDGIWFGDTKNDSGNFWWRYELRKAIEQSQLPIGEEVKPLTTSIKEEKVSTGLDELIEWVEFESNRRWNESHELPDFTEILAKAKEIKSRLNK